MGRSGLHSRSPKRQQAADATFSGCLSNLVPWSACSVLVLTQVPLWCPLTTCVSCRQQLGSHRAWHCEGPFAQPCCTAEWPGSTAGRRRLHWLAASRVLGMGAAPPGGCKGTRAKPDQLKVSSAIQGPCMVLWTLGSHCYPEKAALTLRLLPITRRENVYNPNTVSQYKGGRSKDAWIGIQQSLTKCLGLGASH